MHFFFSEPSSIDPFTNKKIIEGESLTIMCEATGTLPLTVSWVKTSDGERTNGTELVFTYINRNEAGEYKCEASNLCGNDSESVEIDVLCKLSFKTYSIFSWPHFFFLFFEMLSDCSCSF